MSEQIDHNDADDAFLERLHDDDIALTAAEGCVVRDALRVYREQSEAYTQSIENLHAIVCAEGDRLKAELLDMTERYHAVSGEADRFHDSINHRTAYPSGPEKE